MKKTYITSMPDHIGAFLKASECFASLGVNITRVSYNKAVDSHMLFIDAEGSEEQLLNAEDLLADIGYTRGDKAGEGIVLLEFLLRDVPGSVTSVLRLISDYRLNISYINSQQDGTDFQAFQMGLFVDDEERLKEFLSDAQSICQVRAIDYSATEKFFDNSIFYHSFVSGLMSVLNIPEEHRSNLTVNTNLIMQTLDEQGLSPYKTFETISRFANLLAASRGAAFAPRISRHAITDTTEVILIEPPCGSNTAIILSEGQALFVDSGYALYQSEMELLFRQLIPHYDSIEKRIYVTHADVDHCGLLPLFDEVIASKKTQECLRLEYEGKNGFREQNPLHAPYISICKTLTAYQPPRPSRVIGLWGDLDEQQELMQRIGSLDFGELHFEVYEGRGGHLRGETVLIDDEHRVAFTGDVYINIHGLTAEQAAYNKCAPVLMTSVDTDPQLCAQERKAIIERLGTGTWQIFGAHGMKKDYTITAS